MNTNQEGLRFRVASSEPLRRSDQDQPVWSVKPSRVVITKIRGAGLQPHQMMMRATRTNLLSRLDSGCIEEAGSEEEIQFVRYRENGVRFYTQNDA